VPPQRTEQARLRFETGDARVVTSTSIRPNSARACPAMATRSLLDVTIGAGGGTAAPSSPDRGWRCSLEIIRRMMESGLLICRYHRTSPGLANRRITMFKNPTSKVQMFKGTDPSESAKASGAYRRSPPGHGQIDITSAVFRADEAVARASKGDPVASHEPAFLDTITCSAKVSAETFAAGISAPERRGIPRSFAFLDTTTCFAKVSA